MTEALVADTKWKTWLHICQPWEGAHRHLGALQDAVAFYYCSMQLDGRNLNYFQTQQSPHQRLYKQYNPISFSVPNIRIYAHCVDLKSKTEAQGKLKRTDCVLTSTPIL